LVICRAAFADIDEYRLISQGPIEETQRLVKVESVMIFEIEIRWQT